MNLRQFRRSEVVQAAYVTGADAALDTIHVVDVDGQPLSFACPGVCAEGPPAPGDWLILHPGGFTEWVPAAAFNNDWEPVRGSILS